MKQIGDVIVIGSGIIGAATAFALTRATRLRVTLVEKGPLTSGMTRRSAGLVYPFHAHALLSEFARASYAFYNQWAMHLRNIKSGYVETGAAWVAHTDADAEIISAQAPGAAFAQDVVWMDANAFTAMFPGERNSFTCALFTPHAGYADAVQTAQAMVKTAQDNGLHLATGTMVKQIRAAQGRVRGVTTTTGDFEAPVVIVATGSWSERLLAPVGVPLRLQHRRGAVLFYEQPAGLPPAGHPLVLDAHGEFFLRPHPYRMSAAGYISNSPEIFDADRMDEYVPPAASARVTQFAAQYLPGVEHTAPKRGHTMMYDTAADGLPALGRVTNIEGLYVAAGFGAGAFSVAPAVGELLAQWVMDGNAPRDVSLLNPMRTTVRS